jgi:gliding motility-associated-like protein
MGCTASYLYPNLINVHPFPQAAFSANPIVTDIFNSEITFTDLSVGATSWTWNFADPLNSTSNQQNPQFTYEDTGTFCPVLMAENQYTCRDTTSICIEIRPEFTFYAPNAFTPNGDGKNDSWTPEGVGIDASTFELFVFDRWGNLIWKTTQWQQAWDGKANDGKEIAQIDVYVWKCRFKDSVFGKKHEYLGHVLLIK